MSAPNQYRPSDQSDHQYNPQDHYGFNDSSNTQQRFGAYHTAESDSSTHAWQADGGYRRPHFVPSINQPAYGCSMREAFLRFWKKALDFRGRASRSKFWWWMLCDLLIVIMASLVIASLYRSTGGSGFPPRGFRQIPAHVEDGDNHSVHRAFHSPIARFRSRRQDARRVTGRIVRRHAFGRFRGFDDQSWRDAYD